MKLKTITILILSVLLVQCAKEETQDENPPQDEAKPGYIKRVEAKGYTSRIFYDGSHRFIKEEDYAPDSTLIGRISIDYDNMSRPVAYNYGNNTALAGKITFAYIGNDVRPDSIFHYTLKNGTLSMVSKASVEYQTNQIFIQSYTRNLAAIWSFTGKELFTIQDDNIKSYIWQVWDDIHLKWNVIRDIQYEYDDKVNPYFNFDIKNAFFMWGVDFFNKNNMIMQRTKDGFGMLVESESYRYSYDYDNRGYPLIKIVGDYYSHFTDTLTFIYE